MRVSILILQGVVAAPVPTDPAVYQLRRDRNWCGPGHEEGAFPGLDDSGCVKVFPRYFDRSQVGQAVWRDLTGFGLPASKAVNNTVVDELRSVVPPGGKHDVKVAVALVRRHADGHAVRYMGNGMERQPHQPWSSSKVLAAHHAGAVMRSIGDVGLDGRDEKSGWLLSDLLTVVTSYDANASRSDVSSNAIGAYMHWIGGHEDADRFLRDVIGGDVSESFGGNYGEPVPDEVGYTFQSPQTVKITSGPHPTPTQLISNHMSCLTMAEWIRRIAMAREEGQDVADSESILYGAQNSELFPGLQWGGMSMGTDVYLQRAANVTEIDRRSGGLWRIFSKLGAGYSTTEHPGQFEITLNGYASWPVVDDKSKPMSNRGLEFAITAAVAADTGAEADDAMQDVVAKVSQYLISNYDGSQEMLV
mmetsp:Transcript_10131/g.22359  ORF Transcript_10131/g.22359 Transcript_10131/m.22359 type:complete len:418 (+) Transcript_10131:21-1274(+)|eukprot:CAMPEP_0204422314 /NCGR_PEP_ID=MMETSP0470-20130426/35398_1 /ASSEMBLY_ACC=CAM_ASM_000385 /TAXON_ID=2969 /ORGANISM="Oxyrrhis marina" /LENGTH=417 /DNA_ID=CAMNT_0051419533 /DNA_START=21 /DNA_END=1274 /DNA_ORIENTATION=-